VGELRYATTPDGAQVAFRALEGGNGTPIVYLPGMVYSIESIFEDAPYARFVDGLTEMAPVILLERRGIGVSDPLDPERDFYEQWVTDVVAVLDELNVDQAALLGYLIGANIALETALGHPDRVASVVAIHAMVATAGPRLEEVRERNQRVVARDDAAQQQAWAETAPSRASEPAFVDWFQRAGRLAASPRTAAALWDRVLRPGDLDERLAAAEAPVLFLNRRGYTFTMHISLAARQELADALPNGRLVVIDGDDGIPCSGDSTELLYEIAQFLDHRDAPSATRTLTTILFTDLVDSTTSARDRGDDAWRAVLDHHDHLIERTAHRHGGRVVKTTGDGALTVFDAPTRALRCAAELRTRLADLGVGVRMGLHLGEVETRGPDVAGVAVHLAARVMGTAGDGEIITTAALPLATLGGGFSFETCGARFLKGFDDHFELFRLAVKE
jgi:class 3 adenylate cyclase/alpha-beta hydrolase superfamily lysophospholipase